jgi:hypothetical protein
MKKLYAAGKRYLELWGYSVGSSQTDTILGFDSSGAIVELKASGSSYLEKVTKDSWFLPDQPVAFSQGRRGEVYIYQGYGKRGLIRSPNGIVRPVGLEPPKDKPGISINSALSYYVARIDITDAGNGYHLAPAVYIGPPTGSDARQAAAVTRIAGSQVSEVEVTDGGSGYTKTPLVKFTDQVGVPVTGQGASASLKLIGGAGGDYKTGVVYWELYKRSDGAFTIFQCSPTGGYLQKWRDGFIVPACGGSGTGASMYLELTPFGKWYFGVIDTDPGNNTPTCGGTVPSQCQYIKPADDPAPLDDLIQSFQVFDFGSGYQKGDEVVVNLQTATSFGASWTGAPLYNCATYPRGCPVVLKGYVYGSSDCPDDQTCTDASPARQAKINPVLDNPGSGYLTPPTFYTTDGDTIETEIDDDGRIVKLIVTDPNKKYLFPPQLVDKSGGVGGAKGIAIMRPRFRGKYQCYYRFVNDLVTEVEGGPLYSSLSPVHEIDCGDGASVITWTVPAPLDGANAVELWRSTSNQATTLFRVAKIGGTDPFGSLTDALSDYDLTDPKRTGFLAMPILLADGSLNANRFGVAPKNFAVGVVFQDRTWLGVDTDGTKPNTLMYSEADEPEAIPEVNELILQTNVRDTDYITALIPYAGALIVTQSRHCHRLSFVNTPAVDATTNLIAYRGCLNQRCWDLYQGVLYVLDDYGLYSLDQQGNVEHLSAGLDSMFRENTDSSLKQIDFSKRKWFIVRADRALGLVRAHVFFVGDKGTYPTRQIVFCPDLKTFWLEEYPVQFSSAADIRGPDGSIIQIHGSTGLYHLGVGLTDDGQPVSYSYKSGNFEFVTDMQAKNGAQQSSRQISVVYKPTAEDCRLNLSLYYNGSKTPRANVARRDRGVGFIHDDEIPAAFVNLKLLPHQEAETNGVARALFAGKTLEDFSGNDTHVAVQLWGTQTAAGPVTIHTVDLMGVAEKQG